MQDKPSLWVYILSFRRHWFAAMSGGVSVPFAIAGVCVDNKYAQLVFWGLAFTSFCFAAYRVWKDEREKLIVSETKLAALSDSIAYALNFTVTVDTVQHTPQKLEWRVKVKNASGRPVQYASVKMTASLNGAAAKVVNGTGRIIRPNEDPQYSVPFDATYEQREGDLAISIEVEYGLTAASAKAEPRYGGSLSAGGNRRLFDLSHNEAHRNQNS